MPAVNADAGSTFSCSSFPLILLPVYKKKAYLSPTPNHDILPQGLKKKISTCTKETKELLYKPEVIFIFVLYFWVLGAMSGIQNHC